MTQEQDRLSALEEFAVRICQLTNADWIDTETRSALQTANADASKRDALFRLVLLLADGRQKLAPAPQAQAAPAQPPAAAAAPFDQETILRRNTIIFERYEREVTLAKSYTAILTGAGYAGLFAIWAGLREHLDKGALLWSALLTIVSLSVFIAWEMRKARLGEIGTQALAEVVRASFWTPQFEAHAGQAQARHYALVTEANKRWQPLVFWTSTVTGFGAAIILFGAAIAALAGIKHIQLVVG